MKNKTNNTFPGAWQTCEAKEITDKDTGKEFFQLTSHNSVNSHTYFHNPPFHPQMRGLIFKSDRSGTLEYYQMEWQTWRFRQISQASGESLTFPVWCNDGSGLRFFEGKKLVEVDWESGKRTVLKEDNVAGTVLNLSTDLQSRVMYFIRIMPDRYDEYKKVIENGGSVQDKVSIRPPCEVVCWDWLLQKPEKVVVRENYMLAHPQAHPLNANLVCYARCAPQLLDGPKIKCWLAECDSGKIIPISHGGEKWRAGHQFFTHDGRFVYDLDYASKVCRPSFICIRSGKDYSSWIKYAIADRHCHYHLREKDMVMVGDGAPQDSPHRAWDDFIYRIELDENEKIAECQPLVRHAGFKEKNQAWHPHPTFSPDGKYVIFNAGLDGTPDICLVDLP